MLRRPAELCSFCTAGIRPRPATISRSRLAGAANRSLSTRSSSSTIVRASGRWSIRSIPTTGAARRFASQFEPLRPPSPESLGAPKPPKTYRRTRKFVRRLVQATVLGGIALTADTYFYDACLTRSFRTFAAGIVTLLDYKINFRENPPFASSLGEVHHRAAERLFHLLRENGGLYLKIGQAIAMQSAILPPEFQKMFARMFDDAPQNEWKEVCKVIREDFGKNVEEVFGVSFDPKASQGKGIMERTARASASVAQVHWARLADGREVAIKVQKKEIARQVGWDLWAFKVVARLYTWWFDIPLYSLVPYISERLFLETDFTNEANNADKMRELVSGEPRLRDRVYIPEVYRELSSRRVMTAEWIEGVRLWDRDSITSSWHGGWRQGSPGAAGAQLPPLPESVASSIDPARPGSESNPEHLKPARDSWRGKDKSGGLGLSYRPIMETMVSLFSAQMFLWGIVHCDPHPGNIFIRRKPNGSPEVVLIDHGLYITMDPSFRHDYALLWKSLLAFDNTTINRIVKGWGINSPDLFASATLMRPYTGGDKSFSKELRDLTSAERRKQEYNMQMHMRKSVRGILGDETKWPRELIFIGRNLRIVQGNNQFLGSPVNRVKITGTWASRALVEQEGLTFGQRWSEYGRHLIFRMVLVGSDAVWWFSRVRQWLGLGKGMDDDIEQGMRSMAKGFGIEMQHGVFEG